MRNPKSFITAAIAGVTVPCIATAAAAGSKSSHSPTSRGVTGPPT